MAMKVTITDEATNEIDPEEICEIADCLKNSLSSRTLIVTCSVVTTTLQ